MNKTVILYHKSCTDGNGARYAAWKKFGENAEYYACQYGHPLPDFERGPETEVYFLDYSTSRTDLEALGEVCKKVVICDHHTTAQEALKGCNHPRVEVVFDMDRSGAVIAWEYFHPNDPVPMLLQYVQDRDLWKFKLEATEAIHAGLGTLKGKMVAWQKYAEDEMALSSLTAKGQILLDRDKDYVSSQVPENVRVVPFLGYRAGFLNNGNLVSELGHAMYSDQTLSVDIGVCWFVTKDNQVILSMRSKQDEGPDVSAICKKINPSGGGHKHAGGTRVTLSDIRDILNGEWA
jgi:oligoribonuclease NrnB/cAMP/cGMP phosphodiesterase (DHH superfamily)